MARFRTGDRVVVPWGRGEIEGVVIDSFGPKTNPLVRVRIDYRVEMTELDSPTDVALHASDLRHAADSAVAQQASA